MHVAYMDESYDSDHYYIGAAIADEHTWERLAEEYDEIRIATAKAHGTALDAEFHGHALMGGCEDWACLRSKHREAEGIYKRALKAAADLKISYIFRGVDVTHLNARYKYPKQPHEVVFGHILERIDEYAVHARCSEPVAVVADEIATQDQHIQKFIGYQHFGTPGYRSSSLKHIAPRVTFASSRERAGLQAIDMALYLHRRRMDHSATRHPKAQKAAQRLWEYVRPNVRHEWTWVP